MAQQADARAVSLLLHHASLSGSWVTREQLESALGAVCLPPLANDAWLYIPHHRSRAILRPSARGFASVVSGELSQILASALIDPPLGASAAAYCFTSRAAFAAWVIGTWLTPSRGDAATNGLFAILPGGGYHAWARRELLDEGRILPALGAALARQGQGARWLSRLDPADWVRMRQALHRSHGLPPPLVLVGSEPDGVRDGTAGSPQQLEGSGATPASPAMCDAVAATAAVARAAGNDLASLPASAVELLLLLLHLQADPATPRAALVAAAAAVAASPAAAAVATAATRPAAASSARSSAPPSAIPSAPAPAESGGADHHRPALSPASSCVPPPPAEVGRPTTDAAPPPLRGFASDFAGLWFLCNAFVAMGLYGDFTRSRGGVLALAPSRLLDRLALDWFGPPYRRDRLHEALARDGADPPLPDRWQVEPAWLEAFAGEEGKELVTSRRHRTLWHSAGFPLVDAPLPDHPPPSVQPSRWLACLALYLDARIQRATDDPALGLSSLAIPGYCRLSPERIDIDLALADLPLPLRLAGLDRDPGWLPAEGRTLAFHFQ